MRTDIIVIDDFYADPWSVREYALKLDYYHPYEDNEEVAAGQKRPTWMASRFRPASECPFKSSQQLISTLEELTGERIDLDHWNADFPVATDGKASPRHRSMRDRSCLWNCAFHSKPENGQRVGDGVHNGRHRHVENGVGVDGWPGWFNLNEDAPRDGGLKIWRSLDPTHNLDWMTPRENWEMVDDLGNVPNRLLLARGNLPHSGAGGGGTGSTTVASTRPSSSARWCLVEKNPCGSRCEAGSTCGAFRRPCGEGPVRDDLHRHTVEGRWQVGNGPRVDVDLHHPVIVPQAGGAHTAHRTRVVAANRPSAVAWPPLRRRD